MVSVIGAGGHSRSVLGLLKQVDLPVYGIYDSAFDKARKERICDVALMGDIESMTDEHQIVLAIGDNEKRSELYNRFNERIYAPNIISPDAVLHDSRLGRANLIFSGSVINTNAEIGCNNIINTAAIIEHETMVGDHCHISVNATLCGRVIIGNKTFIGAGSVVVNGIHICDDVIVGAGSVVIRNITSPGTYVGNPAKRIK